jgi:hypothetical protein
MHCRRARFFCPGSLDTGLDDAAGYDDPEMLRPLLLAIDPRV